MHKTSSVLMLVVLSVLAGCYSAEPRTKLAIEAWRFCPDNSPENSEIVVPEHAAWTALTIPHVFRHSGLSEQSAGWYATEFTAEGADRNKQFYLFLEGAGSVADVFLNGQHLGNHRGAFTAASFDLTPAVKPDQVNKLFVRVTNRDEEAANCLSQSNLYYTNGGLYRPAWLIKTNPVHIYPDMGSTGVYLTGKNIGTQSADLKVRTHIRNSLSRQVDVVVRHTLTGPDTQSSSFSAEAKIAPDTVQVVAAETSVIKPALWDIGQPNLYTVKTEVLVNGTVSDVITERTGFRTIEMENDRFILNGKELLSRGVCKHHQGEYEWNAMTNEELFTEWDGMIDLGCNTVRLAHYPHRRFEYNIADENGIVVWAETGLAGQKWDKGVKRETTPTADGERITREMVRQNWNHPCIVFWSSGNETYQEVASHYADIIRQEDQTRLVTYASAGEKPSNVDFVAGNTYQGWYYSHYTDFQKLPDNAFISETGSGSWITHHVPYGTIRWEVDRYEPEEYNELFAEFRFQTIFRNNPSGHKMFLWWNFREFYNKKFKNNRNTKGILTLAGLPKDYYYLYKSFMRPDDPVLHLCGRHHFYRQFAPDNGIKAYSNAGQVELFVNGISQGIHKNGDYQQPDCLKKAGNKTDTIKGIVIDNVFFWNAALRPGRNSIEARDNRGNSQTMVLYQKPDDGSVPEDQDGPVVNLTSTNANNTAVFIDRPIEAQGPFYTEVDGSSDNTFDRLPKEVEGARWIATSRLSLEKNKTDLSFQLKEPAIVYVMYATGRFPAHTLKQTDHAVVQAAARLKEALLADGFEDTGISGTWRGHDLWLANYGLATRQAKAGRTITIPAQTLDYVVLIKPAR